MSLGACPLASSCLQIALLYVFRILLWQIRVVKCLWNCSIAWTLITPCNIEKHWYCSSEAIRLWLKTQKFFMIVHTLGFKKVSLGNLFGHVYHHIFICRPVLWSNYTAFWIWKRGIGLMDCFQIYFVKWISPSSERYVKRGCLFGWD